MQWYLKVLRQYSGFRGRASRTEYWMFVLISVIVSVILALIDVVFGLQVGGIGLLGALYSLAVLLPSLAVGARRLHDIGRTGWWQLIQLIPLIGTIALIVFFAIEGHREANPYGPGPKVPPADETVIAY
jgi:uncharacterized membrane protein YhaH (DUF805 family)